MRLLNGLIVLSLAHPLLIDLLPFTKLARAHFGVLPYMIVSAVGAFFVVLDQEAIRRRRFVRAAMALGMAAVVFYDAQGNIRVSREILRVRTSAPEYLQAAARDLDIYLLREDPHSIYICKWLRGIPVSVTNVGRLNRLKPAPGKKLALLFGPVGNYSSRISIINMAFDKDVPADILPGRQPVRLPYYSTFPTLMIEQEIAGALFMEGRVPDYRKDTQHLSLYVFDRLEEKDIADLTAKFRELAGS